VYRPVHITPKEKSSRQQKELQEKKIVLLPCGSQNTKKIVKEPSGTQSIGT
jgi:hypothetical protein